MIKKTFNKVALRLVRESLKTFKKTDTHTSSNNFKYSNCQLKLVKGMCRRSQILAAYVMAVKIFLSRKIPTQNPVLYTAHNLQIGPRKQQTSKQWLMLGGAS